MFTLKVNAGENFYLGEKIPDFYIYMDRVNKQVNYNLKPVYRSLTNELVYCIEPGVTLSGSLYDSYNEYNTLFNLSEDKYNKIKLIAYYGYNYKDHTDIKWYMITQYLIWKEIKPDNWVIYLSDANKNNIDYLYQDNINEIYSLVNSHNENLGINNGYIINYRKNITIDTNSGLENYTLNKGLIEGNKIIIDNLDYGKNDIKLEFNNYNPVLFYFNSGGQNVFKRGDVHKENINFYVYVTAGRVKISECDQETFLDSFNGGTYQILNEDETVLDEFNCQNEDCISDYLPVGFHKIKVKSLPDDYESNNYIYDVEIKDNDIAEVNICSLKKKVVLRSNPPIEEDNKEEIDEKEDEVYEEPYEYTEVEIIENEEIEEIDIPITGKNSYFKYSVVIFILLVCLFKGIKNENHN